MPDSPPNVFIPTSGGSAPSAVGAVFVPTSGGAAPGLPRTVFVPTSGGAAPAAAAVVFIPVGGGGAAVAAGAVFSPATGGAAPAAPRVIFTPASNGAELPNSYTTVFPGVNNNVIFRQLDSGPAPVVQLIMHNYSAPNRITLTGRTVLFELYSNFSSFYQDSLVFADLLATNPAAAAILSAFPVPGSDGSGTISQPLSTGRLFGPVILSGGTTKNVPPAAFIPATASGGVTAPPAIFTP